MNDVTSTVDSEKLTLTFVVEFAAPLERVWQVWEDPRQLELWWGPPTWPATFDRHDFVVGGDSRYHMTGPAEEKSHGWWRITAIDAPHHLEFDDGFADEHGEPNDTMPSLHAVVDLESVEGGTRMTTFTLFSSAEQLEQMTQMGMREGMTLAMGQIERILSGEQHAT